MIIGRGVLPRRQPDAHGQGHYGAPRGGGTHKGIDFACSPNTGIYSNVSGKVTKLGYPYADDLKYRYVEVTDESDFKHRYFYIEPSVELGAVVTLDDVLGAAQDISARYSKGGVMTNHIHYEIKKNGLYHNPHEFWS